MLVVAGVTTGLLALDAEQGAKDLEARLGQGLTGAEFDEHDRLRARRDDLGSATAAITVAATVALTSGVLMWVFDEPPPRPVSDPLPPTELQAGR